MDTYNLDLTVRTLQLSNLIQRLCYLYPQGNLKPSYLNQVASAVHKCAVFLVRHVPAEGYEVTEQTQAARMTRSNYMLSLYAALIRVAKVIAPEDFVKIPEMHRYQVLTAIRGTPYTEAARKAAHDKTIKMQEALKALHQFKEGPPLNQHYLMRGDKKTPEIISALGSIRRNSLEGWLQIMKDLGCQDANALSLAQIMVEKTCSQIGLGRVAALRATLITMPEEPAADKTTDTKEDARAIKSKARRALSRSAKPETEIGETYYSTSIRLNSVRVLAMPQVKELYNNVLRMTTGKSAPRKKLDALVATAFNHKYAAPGEELNTAKGLVDDFVAGLNALQKELDDAARVQREKEIKESKTKAVQALRGMGQLLKVLKENPDLLNEA